MASYIPSGAEGDKKLSSASSSAPAAPKIDLNAVKSLIPKTFQLSDQAQDKPTSQKDVIKKYFVSEKEFQSLARAILAKAIAENQSGEPLDEAQVVSKGLTDIIKSRMQAMKESEVKFQASQAGEAGTPPIRASEIGESDVKRKQEHRKVLVKAEAFFRDADRYQEADAKGKQTILINEGKNQYLAHRNQKGEINVISFHDKEKLASGASGTVFKVYNLTKDIFEALKVPHDISPDKFKEWEKEVTLYNELNKTDQAILYSVGNFFGFTSALNTADLFDVLTASSQDKLSKLATPQHRQQYARETVSQVIDLQNKKKLFLPDLKPENMMVRVNQEKEKKGEVERKGDGEKKTEGEKKERAQETPDVSLKLIDLADALDFDFGTSEEVDVEKLSNLIDQIQQSPQPAGSSTARYLSRADWNALKKLRAEADSFVLPLDEQHITDALNFAQRYQEALSKKGVFTLGVTLYAQLTSDAPFRYTSRFLDIPPEKSGKRSEIPDPKSEMNEEALRMRGYSDRVINSLRKMMAQKPEERSSAEEVQADFNQFKFLTLEECEKFRNKSKKLPQPYSNLEQEATAFKKAYYMLEDYRKEYPDLPTTLNEQIAFLEGKQKEQVVLMLAKKPHIDPRTIEADVAALKKLLVLREENQKITDFNPYIEPRMRE